MKQRKIITAFLALNLCLAVFLTGCSNKENQAQAAAGGKSPSEVLVMTVGEDEVYLNEVNYYALSLLKGMNVPAGTDMSQYYSATYPTMDSAFKAQLLAQIRQSKILYLQAVEQGITLTPEEEEEMNGLIDEFVASSDQDQLEKFGLDREVLTHVYTQIGLIRKMEQQLAEQIEIEGESYGTLESLVFLKIEIDENGNAVLDADGNYSYLSDREQKQQKELAEEALERIQNGEEIEDLIKEYGLEATSGTIHATSDSIKDTYGLNDGEISDVIENSFAYTIVKIIELEDEEYTELSNSYSSGAAVQAAIEEQENIWFDFFPISDEDLVNDVWEAFTFQDFL